MTPASRGEAKLVVGQIVEAIEIFERVNPKSERYPLAALLAGQNYWRRYLTEKAKPEDARDKGQMAADRAKTLERLRASLEAFKKLSAVSRPPYMIETQLLLAEVFAEGNQMTEAVALYQPLLDSVKAEKPKTLDSTTMRVFLGAIRAYTALNDLHKTSQIGTILMELGPDTLEVNRVLIEFARLLRARTEEGGRPIEQGRRRRKSAEVEDAKKRLGAIQNVLVATLTKLAGRQQLSLTGMAFVGDALESLGMTAEAGREYQKILQRAESDPEFAKAAATAAPRVRAIDRRVAPGRAVRGSAEAGRHVDRREAQGVRAAAWKKDASWRPGRRRNRRTTRTPWPTGATCEIGCNRFAARNRRNIMT